MSIDSWLPPLADISLWDSDIEQLIENLYQIYKCDFIVNPPTFRNCCVQRKRYPETEGKDTTFWHIISEGQEPSRTLSKKRCAHLTWVKPIIINEKQPAVKVWPTVRHGETRFNLLLDEKDFLVVLAKRKGYYIIWTAYPLYKHHKRKLLKEYEQYKKTEDAP